MNILLFTGGFFEYVAELCIALHKKEEVKSITLVTANAIDPKVVELIPEGVTIIQFENILYKSIRQNAKLIFKLKKIIKSVKPDVVHVQSFGHPWFHILYFLFPKYKLINTIHDPKPHSGDHVSLKVLKRYKVSQHIINRLTSQIIVHGKSLKQDVQEVYSYFKEEKINVIAHGELNVYQQLASNSFQSTHKDYILFFGRIWRYKGLDIFIESAIQLLEKGTHPQQTFMIAGKGENITPYLDVIPDKYINNFIILNERIPNEHLFELFRNASFAVMPYRDATQSGVIPVAFPTGKTVIASRVGGIPEVITDKENGLLVEAENSSELADAMNLLLSDHRLLKKLESNAKTYATEKLNWDSLAQKTISCYKKALCVE